MNGVCLLCFIFFNILIYFRKFIIYIIKQFIKYFMKWKEILQAYFFQDELHINKVKCYIIKL